MQASALPWIPRSKLKEKKKGWRPPLLDFSAMLDCNNHVSATFHVGFTRLRPENTCRCCCCCGCWETRRYGCGDAVDSKIPRTAFPRHSRFWLVICHIVVDRQACFLCFASCSFVVTREMGRVNALSQLYSSFSQ